MHYWVSVNNYTTQVFVPHTCYRYSMPNQVKIYKTSSAQRLCWDGQMAPMPVHTDRWLVQDAWYQIFIPCDAWGQVYYNIVSPQPLLTDMLIHCVRVGHIHTACTAQVDLITISAPIKYSSALNSNQVVYGLSQWLQPHVMCANSLILHCGSVIRPPTISVWSRWIYVYFPLILYINESFQGNIGM